MLRALALCTVLCASIACQKKPVTTIPTGAVDPAPAASATATPARPASEQLGVSEDLARQCQLQLGDVERAPKFGLDEFELLPEDRDVLTKVAACITTGPLQGRRLQLVGRADPRGTDEYNLGLGERRARTVGSYLERLGVRSTQLATMTRGELDARGRDDASWQRDRRVDLVLD